MERVTICVALVPTVVCPKLTEVVLRVAETAGTVGTVLTPLPHAARKEQPSDRAVSRTDRVRPASLRLRRVQELLA